MTCVCLYAINCEIQRDENQHLCRETHTTPLSLPHNNSSSSLFVVMQFESHLRVHRRRNE